MKKFICILLMTVMVFTLGTAVSFADYTSQFHLMEDNIEALEVKIAKLEADISGDKLSDEEKSAAKSEIKVAKDSIENYKKSMETLKELSEPAEEEKVQDSSSSMKYVGNFKLTGYCPCRSCSEQWGTQTASGRRAVEGVTVAASKQFPLGTKLYIEGVGYRTVDDRGGAIKGNKIDVFVNSHAACYTPAYNTVAKVYLVG